MYTLHLILQFVTLLNERRCLPIEKYIEKKSLTQTFKARNGIAPSYLAELLRDFTPARA